MLMAVANDKLTRLALEDHGVQSGKEQYYNAMEFSPAKKKRLHETIRFSKLIEKGRKLVDRLLLITNKNDSPSKWEEYAAKISVHSRRSTDHLHSRGVKLALTMNITTEKFDQLVTSTCFEIKMTGYLKIIYNPLESKLVETKLCSNEVHYCCKLNLSNERPAYYYGKRKLEILKEADLDDYNDRDTYEATIKEEWDKIWKNPKSAINCYTKNKFQKTKLNELITRQNRNYLDEILFDILLSKTTTTRLINPYNEL